MKDELNPFNLDFEDPKDDAEEYVKCVWCGEELPVEECNYEIDMGWLCDKCERGIKSRGERLTFKKDPDERS